jgi:hypothetical protein
MKTKVYHLYNIKYDTDGEKVKLPTEALVMVEESEDIAETGADIISDNTDWLVVSFKFKEVTDYPESMKKGDFFIRQ